MVSVLRPSGEVRRAPPGAYGAITNAHRIKMGGPWDSSFESIFNEPDSQMADFIGWLSSLQTPPAGHDRAIVDRIAAQFLPPERLGQIARITASLLARSPRVRNEIRITTEYYRRRSGLKDPKASKTLIAANQSGLYDAYFHYMQSGGRWSILFTDGKEFIAGDGFFHNFPARQDGLNSGRKLVVPIIPTAAIVYLSPTNYPAEPKLVTLSLHAEEVSELNYTTQVYAKDFIFYRAQRPELFEDFKVGNYLKFKSNSHTTIDILFDHLSQYCLWGKGGTPVIAQARPFTESSKGDRWLENLRSSRIAPDD